MPKWVRYCSEYVGDAPRALPDTSGSFLEKVIAGQQSRKMTENHGNVHGPENRFCHGNNGNKKDAHRHDSNFHGPMTSPSSIWSPFMKKRVLKPFSKMKPFPEAALAADWKWGCGGRSPPPGQNSWRGISFPPC